MAGKEAPRPDGAPGPGGREGAPPAGAGQGSPQTPHRPLRARIRWGYVALALTAAALVVLIYQNTGPARLRIFWWSFEIPLVLIVVGASVITLLIEKLVRTILGWRRRRARLKQPPPAGRM